MITTNNLLQGCGEKFDLNDCGTKSWICGKSYYRGIEICQVCKSKAIACKELWKDELSFLEEWKCEKMIYGRGQPVINPLWEWLNKRIIFLMQQIKQLEENEI